MSQEHPQYQSYAAKMAVRKQNQSAAHSPPRSLQHSPSYLHDRSPGSIIIKSPEASTLEFLNWSEVRPAVSHEDKAILNSIRDSSPKAEMQAVNLHEYHVQSPQPGQQSRLIKAELTRRAELEKKLAMQRAKYHTLELNYQELLEKSSLHEQHFEATVNKLSEEAEGIQDKQQFDAQLHLVLAEVGELKQRVLAIEALANDLKDLA